MFVDLTAAYDTVWHRRLTCKLLRLLPDRHMVKMIMELVTNCSFTLTTGSETCCRLRCLKNGVTQGSVLAPFLYNIYTYDLPTSVLQKYTYADNLALKHSARDWQAIEGLLSQDLVTLAVYLQTWWLKLSWSKTVSAAFHLNEGRQVISSTLHFTGNACPSPRYQHTWV